MTNNDLRKAILRKKYLKIRKEKSIQMQSRIFDQVAIFTKKFISSKNNPNKNYIGIYWPLIGEIDLRELRTHIKNPLALPCCNNKKSLDYREWSNNSLQKDVCGIPAPLTEPLLRADQIAIIFIPALAIDLNGNRLGYGGGFYDRLRQDPIWRNIPSFVVLPKACVSRNHLPFDSWDIPFEGWITENGKSVIIKT